MVKDGNAPRVSADVVLNEIVPYLDKNADLQAVGMVNKYMAEGMKEHKDAMSIDKDIIKKMHILDSKSDEASVASEIMKRKECEKTGFKGFFISEIPEFCPAVTVTFLARSSPTACKQAHILFVPDLRDICTDELGLNPEDWEGSDFVKACTPQSQERIKRIKEGEDSGPLKLTLPFPGKGKYGGGFEPCHVDLGGTSGPRGVWLRLHLEREAILCSHEELLWNFDQELEKYRAPFPKSLQCDHVCPIAGITKLIASKNLEEIMAQKVLARQGDATKQFIVSFYPSARTPSWEVVVPEGPKLRTGQALPNVTFHGRGPFKYQGYYKSDAAAEVDKIATRLKKSISKIGQNTLGNIIKTIQDAGYVLLEPDEKYTAKVKDAERSEAKRLRKQAESSSYCTILRGLDDDHGHGNSDSDSDSDTHDVVTLTSPAGTTASVMLDSRGRIDCALMEKMFRVPRGNFFLQEMGTRAFIPLDLVQPGGHYIIHAAPLCRPEDLSAAKSSKGQHHQPILTTKTLQATSSLTGSAQKAFDGFMDSDSELAKFLADNWRDSSDMIKRLGQPVHVLERAGVHTFDDLRRMGPSAWEGLSLPLALKRMLMNELQARS